MNFLEPVLLAAQRAAVATEEDYLCDGVLHCSQCHSPKQTVINVGGERLVVPCMCKCQQDAWEKNRAREKREDARIRIKQLRSTGLQDSSIADMRFEYDDGQDMRSMEMARRYVASWRKVRAENIGLLLWGDTGNGKTFTAGCIANALIDKGVPVLMTSFPRILSALNGMFNDDRAAYVETMSGYPLLILDDLGAERESSYALEQVYSVVDTRCKAKKPMIITTNLSLGEMQNAKNMDYKRIYDRVLEMCTPVKYEGKSRRKGIAAKKLGVVKEILSGGTGG